MERDTTPKSLWVAPCSWDIEMTHTAAFNTERYNTVKYIRADIAEARIAKLEDALRYYAGNTAVEGQSFSMKMNCDMGQRAREVLDEK